MKDRWRSSTALYYEAFKDAIDLADRCQKSGRQFVKIRGSWSYLAKVNRAAAGLISASLQPKPT